MKTYKVFKNLNKQPYILGLRLPLFYLYVFLWVIVVFLLSAWITLFNLIFFSFILVFGYGVLKKLNSGVFLDILSNERFPNSIINDNYK